MATKAMITFLDEGGKDDGQRLGLKGANLCEMSKVVEVPEGFVISTQASIEYDGHIHDKLEGRCHRAIKRLEQLTHRKIENLGEGDIPLLLSVRASPTLVTPGLMDSFLNVGINDEICERLASMPGGNRRFALDTYQRFLQLFGKTVLSLDSGIYDNIIRIVTGGEGVKTEAELSELGLETLVEQFKRVALVPENPMKQFWMVLRRMLDSTHEISEKDFKIGDLRVPTAIIVQRMVFGNLNSRSGTGVCFSSAVSLGGNIHGNYISCAEGSDQHQKTRETRNLIDLGPQLYGQLESSLQRLENHFHHNFQFVEYTIENEHLYLLETNTVKTHPRLSWRGSYVVEIQSGVDAEEPNERSSFHLLESAEIPNPISQNPLFLSPGEGKGDGA